MENQNKRLRFKKVPILKKKRKKGYHFDIHKIFDKPRKLFNIVLFSSFLENFLQKL